MVGIKEGALDEAQRHAGGLDALARPRAMHSFLARALWVQALITRGRGDSVTLDEAIALARESGELPLLLSLLTLGGIEEAHQVAEGMARTIPDARLRESFRNTPPL